MSETTVEKVWTTDAGLRAACLFIRGTHRCGYVEVPEGHPLHGVDYHTEHESLSDVNAEELEVGKKGPILTLTAGVGAREGEVRRSPDIVFDVHGGLTYSGAGEDGYPVESDGWWFGFDCAHLGDGRLGERSSTGPVRSLAYVEAECERLAEQITAIFPNGTRSEVAK